MCVYVFMLVCVYVTAYITVTVTVQVKHIRRTYSYNMHLY